MSSHFPLLVNAKREITLCNHDLDYYIVVFIFVCVIPDLMFYTFFTTISDVNDFTAINGDKYPDSEIQVKT